MRIANADSVRVGQGLVCIKGCGEQLAKDQKYKVAIVAKEAVTEHGTERGLIVSNELGIVTRKDSHVPAVWNFDRFRHLEARRPVDVETEE